MNKNAARYEGTPMLRLLDAYVLDAMGVLDDASREQIERLTPELPRILGTGPGTWQEVIAEAMEFPPGLPDRIHAQWQEALKRADTAGGTVDPVAFAHFVCDVQTGNNSSV